MKPPYTSRQGQFLAFIHHYATLHGRPPAEAEMVLFFQVTPPTVHQMILTLERRGLITRAPGQARSIKMTLSPEKLPPLPGASTGTPLRIGVTSNWFAGETEPAFGGAFQKSFKKVRGDFHGRNFLL